MMPPSGTRRGTAAAAVAAVLLAQLAFAAILLRTGEKGVSMAGLPLNSGCWFRRATGLPCPACGMTRSVVLTLHGHLAAALPFNPAGPLWVLAVAVVAGALLWLAWRQRAGISEAGAASRRVRNLALFHGAAFLLVMLAQWMLKLLVRG